jgi:hypothetical protein
MDARLLRAIEDYQHLVAKALALLESAGVKRPASNTEWAACAEPFAGDLPDGFVWRRHGFGCAVFGPAWAVDFDFGDAGEIDGFDPGRILAFVGKRSAEYGFSSSSQIGAAFQAAIRAGDLTLSTGGLYFLDDNRRSPRREDDG